MATGAVVVGRRTFDIAGRWNGDHHGVPIFVPTRGDAARAGSADWVHYVTDGVESAMRAGQGGGGRRDVMVHGADAGAVAARARACSTSWRST